MTSKSNLIVQAKLHTALVPRRWGGFGRRPLRPSPMWSTGWELIQVYAVVIQG